MDILSVMGDLASFGAAGLMGALWVWERRLSRTREEQLTESHGRILRDEQRLSRLSEVIDHNTDAIARFTETQRQLCETWRQMWETKQRGTRD